MRVVIALMESTVDIYHVTFIQSAGVYVHRGCAVTLYSGCLSASPLLQCPPPPRKPRATPAP